MTIDALEKARSAVARGDWPAARGALDDLRRSDPDSADAAEAIELRAQAEYGAGELEAAVTAWERLHAHQLERDPREAARAAAMVAMYLMMDTGLMAPVRGWLTRAERLVADDPDAPAHAVVAMVRTYERFMCGALDDAASSAADAIRLGERLGVLPAVVIGRVATARVTILHGDVTGGLEQLDEVATLLMSGDVDPLTTGMMYCELICAAQGLALHDRAHEWTDVMERWRHGAAFGGINGRCRVHRAELLRISGPCGEAEIEALGACDELRPWMRREFGWPLVELGNIRLRKGDLEGAEAAFVEAYGRAWSPQPGLALVQLERGDVDAAAAMIAEAIDNPFDIPSKERPPFGDLRLAPLLDAQAEIAVAAGDAATARAAADRLRTIADTYASSALDAAANLAAARAALAAGEPDAVIAPASRAVAGWIELGAPYEAASARLVLGEARGRLGEHSQARLEWTAARDGFESFGAERRRVDAQTALDELPGGADTRRRSTVRTRLTGVFRCDGGVRTVGLDGQQAQLRDLKGLRYVALLIAEPGREFRALDLVTAESGTTGGAAPPAPDDRLHAGDGPDAPLPAIDDEAREAYRRRLAEIEADIDDATRANDLGRRELGERDREFLVAELRRAVGLAGRERTEGGSAERARTSVTRSIRYALGRLREVQPDAADHLDRSVVTGSYCCYRPDPVAPIDWTV